MKRAIPVVCMWLLTSACASVPRTAVAALADAQGRSVGQAEFQETKGGVRVRIVAQNLPPGLHGMHIHDTGQCDAPDFTSAGEHFNPFGGKHASHHEGEAHAGDLPNLRVEADGRAAIEAFAEGLNLRHSGHHSLLSGNGTSLLIHAREDDGLTSPSGNAGERIACGVIVEARQSD